ncbi:MAG: hypothetical protein M1365_02185 [Actinobacteria bacterium]|nr:hypothetical protein [Actinomycetota bacterium]
MSKNNNKRADWNLTPLFKSDDDLQIEIERKKVEKANKKFTGKWKERNDYLASAKVLKEALDEYEELIKNYGTGGKEEYYFWLRMMQDQISTGLKAKFTKVHDFSIKLYNELQFFELRLAKIQEDKQKEFLKSPFLKGYRHFLENIFKQAKHNLEENEEKIMNLKSDPAYQKWVQMLSTFLSKEEYKN